MTDAIPQSGLDANNPWPGLDSYTEESQAYFHGRDIEIDELARLVQRERLAVLFGQSGLGKTSLVLAGLFPRLRTTNVLPVYIRLDTAETSPPFTAQITSAVVAAAVASQVEAPTAREGESLWEFFHRREADFWSPRNQLIEVLLVFDQLEELFTVGQRSEAQQLRRRSLVAELGDLIENRVPQHVVSALEALPEEAADWDFAVSRCRVLVSFREDYLPDFESLRTVVPSIMQNRMRLRRMSGSRALGAVVASGGPLVEPAVAEMIVRFVAGRAHRAGEKVPLEDLEIEPALLSLVCREINNRRTAAGRAAITADLIAGAEQDIIGGYYERCVADVPAGVRLFIEDQLLTEAGYRDAYALDDAALLGIPRDVIDRLVARRLLRLEERFGRLQIELTHDVLTPVVRASRERRRLEQAEREAKLAEQRITETRGRLLRARMLAGVLACVVVLTGYAGWQYAGKTAVAAREKVLRQEQQRAEAQDLVDRARRVVGDDPEAAMLLALEGLPSGGDDPAFVPELFSVLTVAWQGVQQRNAVASAGGAAVVLAVSPDGRLVAAGYENGDITVRDAGTGEEVGHIDSRGAGVTALAWTPGSKQLWCSSAEGITFLWSPGAEATAVPHESGGVVLAAAFAPDGNRVATGGMDGAVRLIDSDTGDTVRVLAGHTDWVRAIAISPDSTRIASGSDDRTIRLWDSATGAEIAVLRGHEDWLRSLAFSPDGRFLASASDDGTIRLWEAATGRLVRTLRGHADWVRAVVFSPDGARLGSASDDRTVRIWEVAAATGSVVLGTHPDWVFHLAFTPDGHEIVSASRDGTVHRWATEGGTSAPDSSLVSTMTFSPDGERFATGNEKGEVTVGAVRDPGDRKKYSIHRVPVTQLVFSPDSRWLATRDQGGNYCLLSLDGDRSECERPWSVLEARATTLAFAGKSRRLITGHADGVARVWNLAEAGEWESAGSLSTADRQLPDSKRSPNEPSPVTAVALNPDGQRALTGTRDGLTRLWEVGSGRLLQEFRHLAQVLYVGFAPDGRLIVTTSMDGTARLWDPRSGKELVGVGHGDPVESAALSPDQSTLLTVDARAQVRLFDRSTGRYIGPLGQGRELDTTVRAMSDDGKQILYSNVLGETGIARAMIIHDVALLGSPGTVAGAWFSPDGRSVLVADDRGTCRLWETATGSEISMAGTETTCGDRAYIAFSGSADAGGEGYVLLPTATGASAVRRRRDGKLVTELRGEDYKGIEMALGERIVGLACVARGHCDAVSQTGDGRVRLRDGETGGIHRTLNGNAGPVLAVATSAEGRYLATGARDGRLRLWDAASGAGTHALSGHADAVRAVAFSPDGSRLASGSDDNTVRLWDVASGRQVRVLEGHSDWIRAVAFSPEGSRLASGSDDNTVRLWDVASGRQVRVLEGHSDWIRAVAFSPDGATLASGGDDGTVWLWPIAGPGRVFAEQVGPIVSVAFSPDGRTLAAGRMDGSIRFLDLGPGAPLPAIAAESVPRPTEGRPDLDTRGSLGFSPDGTLFAWVPGVLQAFKPGTGKVVSYRLKDGVTAYGHERLAAFSPDARRVAVVAADLRTINLFEVDTGTRLWALSGHENTVVSLSFHPAGSHLATGSYDGTVRIWNLDSRQEERELAADSTRGGVNVVAFSPDGAGLAVGYDNGEVRLWNWSQGTHETPATLDGWVSSLNFAAKGNLLAAASYTGDLRLISLAGAPNEMRKFTIPEASPPITEIVSLNTPNQVLTRSADGSTRKWDLSAQGEIPSRLDGRGAARNPRVLAAFDPSGRWAVTVGPQRPDEDAATADGDSVGVWVWDLRSGAGLAWFPLAQEVIAVGVAPDGSSVLGGTVDGQPEVFKLLDEISLSVPDLLAYRSAQPGRVLSPDERRTYGLTRAEGPGSGRATTLTDPVARCDALAAHPLDDRRKSAGVPYGLVDGPRAARACELALTSDRRPLSRLDRARLSYQWGRALEWSGDKQGGLEKYRLAAADGHAQAQAMVARLLAEQASGDESIFGEALGLVRQAAESGNASGMVELGETLWEGRGIERDPAAARLWLAAAADKGHPYAHQLLATILAQSQDGRTDLPWALCHAAVATSLLSAWGSIDDANKAAQLRADLARRLPSEKVAEAMAIAEKVTAAMAITDKVPAAMAIADKVPAGMAIVVITIAEKVTAAMAIARKWWPGSRKTCAGLGVVRPVADAG